jgi:hypothetical protein
VTESERFAFSSLQHSRADSVKEGWALWDRLAQLWKGENF